jgi:[ribosomal protein S5]-alanine N-acetyltransferase
MKPFQLVTQRLIIREWRSMDDPEGTLAAMYQSPRYARFIDDRPGAEIRADTREKVRLLLAACRSHVGANYAVALRASVPSGQNIVGQCGIFPAARPDERSIGFGIAEAHWGNGYAVEVAQALIDHCFAQTNPCVTAVIADTHRENAAVQRVLLRVGMELQPTAHNERVVGRLTRASRTPAS